MDNNHALMEDILPRRLGPVPKIVDVEWPSHGKFGNMPSAVLLLVSDDSRELLLQPEYMYRTVCSCQ